MESWTVALKMEEGAGVRVPPTGFMPLFPSSSRRR